MALPIQMLETDEQDTELQAAQPDSYIEEPTEEAPAKRVGDYIGPRITEGNAQRLRFLGKFPGADVEALSMVLDRQDQPGTLPTIKGTDKLLRKLTDLGAVGKTANPATKRPIYSLTSAGRAAAYSFGHDLPDAATLHKKSPRRATHYQLIAHVAAQYASPEGYFRDSLGIEPVGLDGVISEHEMAAAFAEVEKKLAARKAKGEPADFGNWRNGAMAAALKAAREGRLDWPDITTMLPGILTLGQPKADEMRTMTKHQPDLVVIRDGARTGPEALNILAEIELNLKSWEAYEARLLTYAADLKHGFVFERVVYHTTNPQLETLLRKVDRHLGTELFSTKKLTVLPIQHRDGTAVRAEKRITIKEH